MTVFFQTHSGPEGVTALGVFNRGLLMSLTNSRVLEPSLWENTVMDSPLRPWFTANKCT